MPFVTSSFLFLVVMPGATSNFLFLVFVYLTGPMASDLIAMASNRIARAFDLIQWLFHAISCRRLFILLWSYLDMSKCTGLVANSLRHLKDLKAATHF